MTEIRTYTAHLLISIGMLAPIDGNPNGATYKQNNKLKEIKNTIA